MLCWQLLQLHKLEMAAPNPMESEYAAEIIPGLYVGSLRSLGLLEQLGITHILSVVNFEVSRDLSDYTVLHIPLRDDESANLLTHLPAAFTFIHNALTNQSDASAAATASRNLYGPLEAADGEVQWDADPAEPSQPPAPAAPAPLAPSNQQQAEPTAAAAEAQPAAVAPSLSASKVLVHCQAGQSRSVAVVAAYLMKARGIDDTEALKLIRSRWPGADPNEGFIAQLGLFDDMRCSLDPDHPVFRLWCLDQVGRQWQEEGWVDPDSFATLPDEQQAARSKVAVYRCRKCRRILATARNVMQVDEVAVSQAVFDRRKGYMRKVSHTPGQQPAGDDGKALFLEPMDWMAQTVVGVIQGKLYCPGCNARLGSFNWSGITNEAGLWITPAFQVHTSKVDVLQPAKALASSVNIRVPLVGPAAAAAAAVQPAASTPQTQAAPTPQEQQQQGMSGPCQTAWFTTLVLDCDGVLVDSERASCEALRQGILKVTGFDIPHDFPRDYHQVFGMDVKGCVEHYKQKFERHDWVDVDQLAVDVQAAKEIAYQELTQRMGIPAFPGAAPLIAAARALGMSVGIGSSGAPSKIHHNLSTSGLAGLVAEEHIVSAAHVAKGKPAPDVYIEVIRRLSCDTNPSRALVVEDTVNGLKAARGAGACGVAVTTSLPRHTLQPWADLVLDRLEELIPLLGTLAPETLGSSQPQ